MSSFDKKLTEFWAYWGRNTSVDEEASEDFRFSQLLRLSLIQFSAGISITLLSGILYRAMAVDLAITSTVVGVLLALPFLIAPMRTLIGHWSDNYVAGVHLRRVPFIVSGSMIQFIGLAMLPFTLLVLGNEFGSEGLSTWLGLFFTAFAILIAAGGVHITQTVGLALATDLAKEDQQVNVVGMMFVSMLIAAIVSGFILSGFLAEFSPSRLILAVHLCALTTLVLNLIASWKQEPLLHLDVSSSRIMGQPSFRQSWSAFATDQHARRWLIVVAIGTLAFMLSDYLFEPYAWQVLGLSVTSAALLTTILAIGALFGFVIASTTLGTGRDPAAISALGTMVALPALAVIILAAPTQSEILLCLGILAAGCGTGLFAHGTLTATIRMTPRTHIGMALGTWGAVKVTAAGAGVMVGAILKDLCQNFTLLDAWSPIANGYLMVYSFEMIMLWVALLLMLPLLPLRATKATQKADTD